MGSRAFLVACSCLGLIGFTACGQPAAEAAWELAIPDTSFELSPLLREVSGIEFVGDRLMALHDEDGDIFELDPASGGILQVMKVTGKGDFEGLAVKNDELVLLRSDGRLFQGLEETSEIRLDLHRSCDAEGIAFHRQSDQFWIACKESPGKSLGPVRGIFAAPAGAGSGKKELPVDLVLELKTPPVREGGPPGRRASFKPSGMAFLADGESFLLLSTVAPSMYHYSRSGELLRAWSLPRRLLPQPEGVAVHRDGRIFVASEGASGPAVLAVFSGLLP